jgi:hypothetical protein
MFLCLPPPTIIFVVAFFSAEEEDGRAAWRLHPWASDVERVQGHDE